MVAGNSEAPWRFRQLKSWIHLVSPTFMKKRKLFFKYLKENEPDAIWYMVKNDKQLLQVLDRHLSYLGYAIRVTSKPTRKNPSETMMFDSIAQALDELKLHCPFGAIMSSLTGKREYVNGYKFELFKLTL